jgi:hypothetical protein
MIFCCQGWNNETEATLPSPEELQAASFDDLDVEKKNGSDDAISGKVIVATEAARQQEMVNNTAHGPSPSSGR